MEMGGFVLGKQINGAFLHSPKVLSQFMKILFLSPSQLMDSNSHAYELPALTGWILPEEAYTAFRECCVYVTSPHHSFSGTETVVILLISGMLMCLLLCS